MNDPSTLALESVPSAPTDPSLLTMHLDICRMRAELELIETRIGRIRASEVEAASDARPFVDRAQDLVDRTVVSLYESGRAEIEAIDRQSRLDAEARLADASRQAQALLSSAREELADALTERAERAAPGRARAADVVILPDVGLILLPGDDLVVLPDDGLVVLPGDETLVPAAEGLIVLPGDDVVVVLPDADEAAAEAGAEAAVVEAEPDTVEVAEPVDVVELVDALEVVEPVAAVVESVDAGVVDVDGAEAVVEEAAPPATEGSSDTVSASAAFDVWLAMAPPPLTAAEVEQAEGAVVGRSGWFRALQAIAVLVLIALAVAVALYFIG